MMIDELARHEPEHHGLLDRTKSKQAETKQTRLSAGFVSEAIEET